MSCVGVGATDAGTAVATAVADGTVGSPVNDSDSSVDGLDGIACATATSCVAGRSRGRQLGGVVVPITLPVVALPPETGTGSGGGAGGSGAGGGSGTGSGTSTAHLTVSDVKVKGSRVTLRLSCSDAARCTGAVTETISRRTTAHGKRVGPHDQDRTR